MASVEEIRLWTPGCAIWARPMNPRQWEKAVYDGLDLGTSPYSVVYHLDGLRAQKHGRVEDVALREQEKQGSDRPDSDKADVE